MTSLICTECNDTITPNTLNAEGCTLTSAGWVCGTCACKGERTAIIDMVEHYAACVLQDDTRRALKMLSEHIRCGMHLGPHAAAPQDKVMVTRAELRAKASSPELRAAKEISVINDSGEPVMVLLRQTHPLEKD